MALLELDALRVEIGERVICRDLSLPLNSGEFLGVLGRNGTGKTTLLHTAMGFHAPSGGNIRLGDIDVSNISRRQLARELGLLFQEADNNMPATVLETVLLGRYPYSQNLLWDSEADIKLCRETLALVGLADLQRRQVSTLSGGEKQRLAMALLLAQSPKVLLLDEPSNHLDIDYQIRLLELLSEKVRSNDGAIMMASHDINLVARFCDQTMLLLGDGEIVTGPTDKVLTVDNLELAFQCRIVTVRHNNRNYFFPG